MQRKRRSEGKLFELPDDFIAGKDEQFLESFGGYLIAHGLATRWHRRQESGVDVAFEIFGGSTSEELLYRIARDHAQDVFYVADANGRRLDEGPLDHVMAAVDRLARNRSGSEGPA